MAIPVDWESLLLNCAGVAILKSHPDLPRMTLGRHIGSRLAKETGDTKFTEHRCTNRISAVERAYASTKLSTLLRGLTQSSRFADAAVVTQFCKLRLGEVCASAHYVSVEASCFPCVHLNQLLCPF